MYTVEGKFILFSFCVPCFFRPMVDDLWFDSRIDKVSTASDPIKNVFGVVCAVHFVCVCEQTKRFLLKLFRFSLIWEVAHSWKAHINGTHSWFTRSIALSHNIFHSFFLALCLILWIIRHILPFGPSHGQLNGIGRCYIDAIALKTMRISHMNITTITTTIVVKRCDFIYWSHTDASKRVTMHHFQLYMLRTNARLEHCPTLCRWMNWCGV